MRLGSSCRALPEREFEREERNGKAEERDEVRDQERCTSVSVAQERKSPYVAHPNSAANCGKEVGDS